MLNETPSQSLRDSISISTKLSARLHLNKSRWSLNEMRWSLIVVSLFLMLLINDTIQSQHLQTSIHQEQMAYYHSLGTRNTSFYDSLDGFTGNISSEKFDNCRLNLVVFGFHPYWTGSDYLNYQWNLLSDLCYFSYEIDPSTGDPVTVHDWLTDPAIDSAQAHGVRVHLCATLFSGHTAFFNNPGARSNLVTSLVSLVRQRNAGGVNIDVEAMPSSLRDSLTVFMTELSSRLKATIPGAKISIDLPAVDWDNDFDIPSLSGSVDWFFIMGYDYYWNGSDEAGPVSPLYSLTASFNYSLARTISDYEHAGIEPGKFILGIPYYGRRWATASGEIPSRTISSGVALTYANIRNNNVNYNSENYHWEPNSYSSCYVYYDNNSWKQCFIGLDLDLREKYDIVNYRGLAGIGIWALGYDNGYTELWQAISDKFSDCYIPLTYDTIFDSGGPAWNYYTFEDYKMTVEQGFNDMRYLTFTSFSVEKGYDSLCIYAGKDSTAVLLAGLTGYDNPGTFTSGNGVFTLKFSSDGMQNASGWQVVYHDGSMGILPVDPNYDNLTFYPNPAIDEITIVIPGEFQPGTLIICDLKGKALAEVKMDSFSGESDAILNVGSWPAGTYIATFRNSSGQIRSGRFQKGSK